jgi:hypothetical protein
MNANAQSAHMGFNTNGEFYIEAKSTGGSTYTLIWKTSGNKIEMRVNGSLVRTI